MNEEQFKKIIKKSNLETSDDFINNLMSTIEVNKERKKALNKLFKITLFTVAVVTAVTSFIMFKYLGDKNGLVVIFTSIPKTPIFVVFMVITLGYINSFIRLNERNRG
ncbi:MAG: hypothetical protein ED556_03910 [Winogradskyella sp.]|uniref:hypothetical protein n=1 Tax=Winogradskyella sp. TaxID=1883156 RepID=UPI000F3BD97C|nr:hypothetical protein [Winogradskyella sp.]RNC88339.1 MAG: hypothetical protein ED556_03910 [Winogradskyella sp.]